MIGINLRPRRRAAAATAIVASMGVAVRQMPDGVGAEYNTQATRFAFPAPTMAVRWTIAMASFTRRPTRSMTTSVSGQQRLKRSRRLHRWCDVHADGRW